MKKLCFLLALLLSLSLAKQGNSSSRPRYGSTLTVPLNTLPTSIDPLLVKTQEEIWLVLSLFDTLYSLEPSGTISPTLVAGEPSISDDKKTLTFRLLPRLMFHNGDLLRAEDVVASFTRLLTKGSSYAWLFADLDGAKELFTGKAKTVSGLKAISSEEFSLTFVRPPVLEEVLLRLTAAPTAIVKVQGASTLIGSGPFYREPKKSAKGEIRLLPFLDHARGRPFLDRLIFKQFKLLDAQVGFSKRDLLLLFSEPLSSDGNAKLLTGPEVLSEAYLLHSPDSSFVGLEEFRRALHAAVDKDTLFAYALGDLLDRGRVAKKILPEGLSPRSTLRTSFNQEEAKKELNLAAAKVKPPSELVILYNEAQSGHKALAEQLREFLVEIKAPKPREVGADAASFQSKVSKGDFAVAVFHFAPVAPQGLALPNLVASSGDLAGAFDMVAKGNHLTESAAKKKEDSLSNRLIMIDHRPPAVLYDPSVKGLAFTSVGVIDFSRIWIEP